MTDHTGEVYGPAVLLGTLPVGARFRSVIVDVPPRGFRPLPDRIKYGTLEDLSSACATVTVERVVSRTFTTEEGKDVTLATASERTTWSLGTVVEPLLTPEVLV